MMRTLTKDIVESINIYFAQKVVRSQRRRVGEWFSFENNLFWHSKKKNDLPRNESSSCHNSHSVEIQRYFSADQILREINFGVTYLLVEYQ